MPPAEWITFIAMVLGPAGAGGIVIAWLGYRKQKSKPPALPPEAMAAIGQGIGAQFATDQNTFAVERNTIKVDALGDRVEELCRVAKDIHRVLDERMPQRSRREP